MKRLATTLEVVAEMPHTNAVKAAKGWRPAMDHVGIDVHKKESQVCILTVLATSPILARGRPQAARR